MENVGHRVCGTSVPSMQWFIQQILHYVIMTLTLCTRRVEKKKHQTKWHIHSYRASQNNTKPYIVSAQRRQRNAARPKRSLECAWRTHTHKNALRSAHSNEFAKFSFIFLWSLSAHEAEQSSVSSLSCRSVATLHGGEKLNLAQHTDTLTLISHHKLFSFFFSALIFFLLVFTAERVCDRLETMKEWEHRIKIRNSIHLMRPDDNPLISNLDLVTLDGLEKCILLNLPCIPDRLPYEHMLGQQRSCPGSHRRLWIRQCLSLYAIRAQ